MNRFMKFISRVKLVLSRKSKVTAASVLSKLDILDDPIYAATPGKITVLNWPDAPEITPSVNCSDDLEALIAQTAENEPIEDIFGYGISIAGAVKDTVFNPMIEEYRQIKGFQAYEVSKDGNVRNFISKVPVKKYVCGKIGAKGYKVKLRNEITLEYHHLQLHRLVALTWIPNAYSFTHTVVKFIDGDRQNPHADNLIWVKRTKVNQNKTIKSKV